jgi:hypothetical protein
MNFDNLEPIKGFSKSLDDQYFIPASKDWIILISDVKGEVAPKNWS